MPFSERNRRTLVASPCGFFFGYHVGAQWFLYSFINVSKSKPAVEAVLGDLGWLPLPDILDTQRIKYMTYLLALPNDRLPRVILKDMLESHERGVSLAWPAARSICKILSDRGLDGALSANNTDLPRVF